MTASPKALHGLTTVPIDLPSRRLAVLPSLLCPGNTSLLVPPLTHQACSCLSAFTCAISSAWNTFPWLHAGVPHSPCLAFCSEVSQKGFLDSLSERARSPRLHHSPISFPFLALFVLALITPMTFYVFVQDLPPSTRMQAPCGKKLSFYPLLYLY